MNSATLVKWDASVVGEHPPIGRWIHANGKVRVSKKCPNRFMRGFGLMLGYTWLPGVDAAGMPGCLEVMELNEGKAPVTTWRK